jgi:hypothetical protein
MGAKMARYTEKEKQEALETLKRCFPEGSTVYGIVRSISRSGMSRTISVLSLKKESFPYGAAWFSHPNHAAAVVTGRALVRGFQDGIRSNGCGFDHLESIARDLSQVLGYTGADELRHESL